MSQTQKPLDILTPIVCSRSTSRVFPQHPEHILRIWLTTVRFADVMCVTTGTDRRESVRLGMMQPYFFPYLGYFALIAATDEWVVFDTAQYIRRGWVNRNRVLSSGKDGWKYIRIPVGKAARQAPISQIKTATPSALLSELVNSLDEYRCWRAPFYDETVQLIDSCLSDAPDDLTKCLIRCLSQTCDYLEVPFVPRLYSALDTTPLIDPQPGDWALHTASYLGASEYINPPGGRDLFDRHAFQKAGIHLTLLNHTLPAYQQRTEYVPGLSIIDVLMWNGRRRTRELLNDYHLDRVA